MSTLGYLYTHTETHTQIAVSVSTHTYIHTYTHTLPARSVAYTKLYIHSKSIANKLLASWAHPYLELSLKNFLTQSDSHSKAT